jgi:hypothetical protein
MEGGKALAAPVIGVRFVYLDAMSTAVLNPETGGRRKPSSLMPA